MLNNRKTEQLDLGKFGLRYESDFDGGVNPKWDQHIGECKGGAKNLNIYGLGDYWVCIGCVYVPECQKAACSAGEQSDF